MIHRLMTGVLVWPRLERQLNRYRFVTVHPHRSPRCRYDACNALEGKRGTIGARVLVPACSPHAGDLSEGHDVPTPDQAHFPRTGEDIELGAGTFTLEPRPEDGLLSVGLLEGLSPSALFRCHWQMVTIWFKEES